MAAGQSAGRAPVASSLRNNSNNNTSMAKHNKHACQSASRTPTARTTCTAAPRATAATKRSKAAFRPSASMSQSLSPSTPPASTSSLLLPSSSASSSSSPSSPSPFTVLLCSSLFVCVLLQMSCLACANHHHYSSSSHHRHPQHIAKLSNLEAKVGLHVVFNCHLDFPYDLPIPYVIHWSKDSKRIFTWYEGVAVTNDLYTGRLHLIADHPDFGQASVNLTAIRESDQGAYHCQIVFPNRSPNKRNNGTLYHLTVQGGSLIKIPPVNQTIMEGQTAFFPCTMKYPETSVVNWYKDGVLLQDVQDLLRRLYIGKDGSLSIDPTMMSDLGEYECNVRSQEDEEEVQTAKAFLNIQYKAKVIYAPPEVYLPFGQPAVLDCHFRANPPLKNLRWEKDGLLFDSYNVPGVYYKNNGSIYFSKVDENHAGSYTCTPYNELGTDGPSPIISVIVLRPPIFSIAPKAIYIQKLGERAELSCEAIDRDGHNRPSIVWARRDGTPLPADRHTVSGGNLTISELIESDRGVYECAATNEAATITAETELMIENIAPRPPYNLTANSTDTTITIHWQPDRSYLSPKSPKVGYLRPNLEYTVWYRLTDAQEWRTLRILQQNIMEATIQQLQPGREYEFMVLSQDKYGDGMFSKQFRFSTQQSKGMAGGGALRPAHATGAQASTGTGLGVDLSAPWNLTAARNQQGWLLHWEHPRSGLDQLRLYMVRWWKEPEHFLIGSIETFDNYHQVRHLKDDGRFRVQVAALTVDGVEVASEELVIDVPAHRKIRALVIGSSVGVIFLLCALAAFLYVKRSCLRHLFAGEEEEEHDDVVGPGGGSASSLESSARTATGKLNNA